MTGKKLEIDRNFVHIWIVPKAPLDIFCEQNIVSKSGNVMFVQTNVAQNICAKIVDFFGISIFSWLIFYLLRQGTETIPSKISKYLEIELKFGH